MATFAFLLSTSAFELEMNGSDDQIESSCADPEEGQGVRTPTEKSQNIGFLSNTGPDPLKITELQSQLSMLGHNQYASETPFKWRFAGVPMMTRY